MNLLNRLRNWIHATATALAQATALAAVTAEVNDSPGWTDLNARPADRPWAEHFEDLADALEAWRRNFIVRRVVVITSSYVVGRSGLTVSSKKPRIESFIQRFSTHPENRLRSRQSSWCDEITRSGELFIALSAPGPDGFGFVRAIPASCIRAIKTDPHDYERALEFHETIPGKMEPKVWKSKHTGGPDEPILLHYPFNRVVGATRGESDLTPLLPVAQRYTAWLKGRVRSNDLRNKLAVADIEIDDDNQVEAKRAQYESNPPTDGSIYVHGKGERLSFPAANIQGWDAEPDGRAQRYAIASASNYPIHFFGEGATANRSTAKEMGGPTHSFLEMRQADFGEALIDLAETAYRRAAQAGHRRLPADGDLALEYNAPDVSEADNLELAKAAATVVGAFARMRQYGWITDELAVGLAFKFFGEILTEEQIEQILDWSDEHATDEDEDDESGDDESGDDGERELVAHSNGSWPKY